MLEVSRRANGIDISFSATVDNIDRADEETKRFLWKMGLETETFAIRLSVREGLLNALQHGSFSDPRKIIKYWLRLEEKLLIIEIEDEMMIPHKDKEIHCIFPRILRFSSILELNLCTWILWSA